MPLIKLHAAGSNTPDLPGPPPGAPDYSIFRDTEEGVDFFKLNATISTVGGDVEKDNPRDDPESVGTVTAFSVEGEAIDLSVADISIEPEKLTESIDASWWSQAFAGDDVVIGTRGDDSLSGWDGDDQLFGLAGRDELYGGGGDDALFGGKGQDYLHGWRGDNGLFGGAGGDMFFIDSGRNYVETGRGADTLVLDYTRGSATVADFSVESDEIILAIIRTDDPPTAEELIDQGALKIRGDEFHTVIRFGDMKVDLLGLARDDFSLDLITVA